MGNAFYQTDLLTHEQKMEFVKSLVLTLDLRKEQGQDVWNCSYDYHFAHARRILDQLGFDTRKVDEVLNFFLENGVDVTAK